MSSGGGVWGGGRMSHRRHRKFTGVPGKSPKLRLQLEIENRQREISEKEVKARHKSEMFDSVEELMKKRRGK